MPARAVPKRDDHVVKPAHPPLVSTESDAKFDQCVKRRRVDRDVNEAQAALHHGRLKEATAALAEITELDPNSPELKELTAQLDVLRRGRPPSHRGHWFAATAAVGGLVLGVLSVSQTIQPMSAPAVERRHRACLCQIRSTLRPRCPRGPIQRRRRSHAESGRRRRPGDNAIQRPQSPPETGGNSRADADGCRATRFRRSLAGRGNPCSAIAAAPGIVPCVDIDRSADRSAPGRGCPTPVVTAETAVGSATDAPAAIVPTGSDEEQVKEVLDRYRQGVRASHCAIGARCVAGGGRSGTRACVRRPAIAAADVRRLRSLGERHFRVRDLPWVNTLCAEGRQSIPPHRTAHVVLQASQERYGLEDPVNAGGALTRPGLCPRPRLGGFVTTNTRARKTA